MGNCAIRIGAGLKLRYTNQFPQCVLYDTIQTIPHTYIVYIFEVPNLATLTLMLLVANLANTKSIKTTETLAHGYSSEST